LAIVTTFDTLIFFLFVGGGSGVCFSFWDDDRGWRLFKIFLHRAALSSAFNAFDESIFFFFFGGGSGTRFSFWDDERGWRLFKIFLCRSSLLGCFFVEIVVVVVVVVVAALVIAALVVAAMVAALVLIFFDGTGPISMSTPVAEDIFVLWRESDLFGMSETRTQTLKLTK
jgi:hypothetical protein